jgi:hypothetical protein
MQVMVQAWMRGAMHAKAVVDDKSLILNAMSVVPIEGPSNE